MLTSHALVHEQTHASFCTVTRLVGEAGRQKNGSYIKLIQTKSEDYLEELVSDFWKETLLLFKCISQHFELHKLSAFLFHYIQEKAKIHSADIFKTHKETLKALVGKGGNVLF